MAKARMGRAVVTAVAVVLGVGVLGGCEELTRPAPKLKADATTPVTRDQLVRRYGCSERNGIEPDGGVIYWTKFKQGTQIIHYYKHLRQFEHAQTKAYIKDGWEQWIYCEA